SRASGDDLKTLVGMRNGTVHAAENAEVETRLLVAFVEYADELLKDLDRDRAGFWGGQLEVVDALLTNASDRVLHAVEVKLAEARAYFAERYGNEPEQLVNLVRELSEPYGDGDDEVPTECPACQSLGLATGSYDVDWEPDDWEEGEVTHVSGTVWFTTSAFECRVCKLRLNSVAEAEAAGLRRWEVEGADPAKYESAVDEDALIEEYRDHYR